MDETRDGQLLTETKLSMTGLTYAVSGLGMLEISWLTKTQFLSPSLTAHTGGKVSGTKAVCH